MHIITIKMFEILQEFPVWHGGMKYANTVSRMAHIDSLDAIFPLEIIRRRRHILRNNKQE